MLSIVIPTTGDRVVNASIINMFQDLKNVYGVEICIHFNGLTKKQIEVNNLFTIADKYSNSVIREPIDISMHKAFILSTKNYVWQMGDDDHPNLNCFELIINLLSKKKYDLLLGKLSGKNNVKGINSLLSELFPRWNLQLRSIQFAYLLFWRSLPYGSFIVRRQILDNYGWKEFQGTSHSYGGALWVGLSELSYLQCKILRINKNIFLSVDIPKTWQNDASKIYNNEIPLFFKLIGKNILKLRPINYFISFLYSLILLKKRIKKCFY
jgi:hypothetical protein